MKFVEELKNPTGRLQSIRRQLKNKKDNDGRNLQEVQIEVPHEVYEKLYQLAIDYNSTVNEVCWLILEEVIEEDLGN